MVATGAWNQHLLDKRALVLNLPASLKKASLDMNAASAVGPNSRWIGEQMTPGRTLLSHLICALRRPFLATQKNSVLRLSSLGGGTGICLTAVFYILYGVQVCLLIGFD